MESFGIVRPLLFLFLSASPAFGQWTSTNLSSIRGELSGVTVGSKAVFAGGTASPAGPRSARVDIYDYILDTWTTASLSQARGGLTRSGTANGNKAFFAGGRLEGGGVTNVVDIYDVQTNTWTMSTLSQARRDVAAASLENLVFFAGGMTNDNADPGSSRVDIYNVQTNVWSMASLSVARHGITAASAGGKVLFAGGRDHTGTIYYNTVDMYDYGTDSWSTATLSQGRANIAVAVHGNKIFFGGGAHSSESDVVDIYDAISNTWSSATLSAPRNGLMAGAAGTKVIFAGGSEPSGGGTPGNRVDIYDVVEDSWTTTTMPTGRSVMASASVGGKIIFAGGMTNDFTSAVDIYTVCTPPVVNTGTEIEICPNASTTLAATGATSYQWHPTIGLSSSTDPTVEASPAVTTVYQVTGKSADQCASSAFVKVTVLTRTTVSPAQTICHGTSTTLEAFGAGTYTWVPSTGLSATSGGSITASPVQTTTYTVTGGLANCETTADVTVTVVKPVIDATESFSICNGESETLQASGAVSYIWNPSAGLSLTTGSNVLAQPDETTTYTVTGTDAFNCTDTDEVTVTVTPLPNVTINPADPICVGESATLTAGGAATYVWSPSASLSSSTGSSVVAKPQQSTVYTVTGTGANGCEKNVPVTVTVIAISKPSITATQEDNWVLTSSSPSDNQWFKDGVQIAGAIGQSLSVSESGKYQVRISENGCLSDLSDEYNLLVTSVEYNSSAKNIHLHPNPSNHFIQVSRDAFNNGRAVVILIKDVLGRTVANKTIFETGDNLIDISHLSIGNYLLQATQGQRVITVKFIRK